MNVGAGELLLIAMITAIMLVLVAVVIIVVAFAVRSSRRAGPTPPADAVG